jgi:hypothetical protein
MALSITRAPFFSRSARSRALNEPEPVMTAIELVDEERHRSPRMRRIPLVTTEVLRMGPRDCGALR